MELNGVQEEGKCILPLSLMTDYDDGSPVSLVLPSASQVMIVFSISISMMTFFS